jgi:hypothetical protein
MLMAEELLQYHDARTYEGSFEFESRWISELRRVVHDEGQNLDMQVADTVSFQGLLRDLSALVHDSSPTHHPDGSSSHQ